METVIRQRIELAPSRGQLQGPDGVTAWWHLRGSQHSDVRAEEMGHAERLIRT